MKKDYFLIIFTLLFVNCLMGQTFTWSPSMAIPDNGPQTCNSQTVSGLTGNLDCNTPFGLESVCIRINHSWDSDLDIYLRAPDGTIIELTTDNGGGGNNYGVGANPTCFTMSAITNVTAGIAPFNAGPYIPEGDLSQINNGQNGNGVWQLCITDDSGGDVGTLLGWRLVFGSSPDCPPPPTPQDCSGGVTVCNSQSFSGNSSGSGTTQELNGTNSGCLSIEHQSSWYFFEASAAGQVAFTISPANGTDDYDFAVWGPYPTGSTPSSICPPTVAPLRCSYAAGGGNTGLLNGSGDNTEGAFGNRFVEDINVNVGDVFILVVDNFSASLSPFDLNWNLTGGASLDCTPLPVILTDFYGNAENGFNSLHWVTENEVNNNFFRIQRSENGIDFYDIGTVSGAGNSVNKLEYSFNDYEVNNDYYYRLKQVDFNGKYELSNTIFIKNKIINDVNIFPNPSNENLFISLNNSTTDEFIWIIYTDVVGKSRHKELVSIQDGVNSYKLNLFSNLNSGIYFVQAIRENKEVIKTTKIIKE